MIYINYYINHFNNKSIYIVDNKNDLIDLYLSVYKTEKTIIGNYRNEEC